MSLPATRSRWPTSAWVRRGSGNWATCSPSPEIQIVAVCDPNKGSSDYVEWGNSGIRNQIRTYIGEPAWRENDQGCPGGREVGREVVDAYYTRQRSTEKFKACSTYADFRELLDKEKDLDAVKIMTPDHLHATISIAAMKKGKHVLMHKPIANRLYEGRQVIETARKAKVATHLLAYGNGVGNGLIAERIKAGVIGPLREVHSWTNRPVWPQYAEIPTDKPAVPKGFDWDLWLGPAWIAPIIRTTRIPCSVAGTISAAARWRTWASTPCGRYSPGSIWAFPRRRGPGDPRLLDRGQH